MLLMARPPSGTACGTLLATPPGCRKSLGMISDSAFCVEAEADSQMCVCSNANSCQLTKALPAATFDEVIALGSTTKQLEAPSRWSCPYLLRQRQRVRVRFATGAAGAAAVNGAVAWPDLRVGSHLLRPASAAETQCQQRRWQKAELPSRISAQQRSARPGRWRG